MLQRTPLDLVDACIAIFAVAVGVFFALL